MNHQLTVKESIQINASVENVWKVLTTPKHIKTFLFGTETETDWKVGSKINFKGNYNGNEYHDKGIVQENRTNEFLSYKYWAQYSGLPDEIENYFLVNYHFDKVDNGTTTFSWEQIGFASEQGYEHTKNGLASMLKQIKDIAESI